MEILDRGLTPEEADAVAGWAYPPPYDLYDASESAELADYHPVVREGELVGFVCLGEHARVPGQWEARDAVDVGAGLRPDLLSQGLGTELMQMVTERFAGRPLRAAVAAFNERSQRLCQSAGFEVVRRFTGPDGRLFVEMVRPAAD